MKFKTIGVKFVEYRSLIFLNVKIELKNADFEIQMQLESILGYYMVIFNVRDYDKFIKISRSHSNC